MIPLIVINHNKLDVLKIALDSYKKLGDVDIHIVDNGSTYPPLLNFYNSISTTIHYFDNISTPEDLPKHVNMVLDNLEYDYDHYIVTDSDIEIENPCILLATFIKILNTYPGAQMVSPMLRIDDLPPNRYTLEQHKLQYQQFWNKPRYTLHDGIQCIQSIVDTTFAMYRKGYVFKRFSVGFRVFEPYMAKHLDWYNNVQEVSGELLHFLTKANENVSTAKKHILSHYQHPIKPTLNEE